MNILIAIDPSYSNTGIAGYIDDKCVAWDSMPLPSLALGKKHRPACPTAYRFDKLAAFIAAFSVRVLQLAQVAPDHPITFVVETPQTKVYGSRFHKTRRNGGADMVSQSGLCGFLLARLTMNHSNVHEISATEWSLRIPAGKGDDKPNRRFLAGMLVSKNPSLLNSDEADAILLGDWFLKRKHLERLRGAG